MSRLNKLFMITTLAISATAMGQPVLDGQLDAGYPTASALQGISTNFGDSDFGQPGFSNGSELNSIHVDVQDGSIVIFLSGNLESNFNKLEVFIDARDGGQNQLRHDNSDVDFGGLRRMGNSNENATDGLIFDEGFEPDAWISLTCADDGFGGFVTYANFAELRTNGNGTGLFLGSGSSGTDVMNGENGIAIAIDNSNVGGVGGGIGNDCGIDVNTGMEISIPSFVIDWDFEGLPLDDIKVCAFINGSGHDFLSNQIMPGIPPSDNLGEPRGLDFNNILGNQYASMGDEATECPTYNYGACCLGEVCQILDADNCTAGGGTYLGNDTTCDDNPCLPPDCPSDVNDDGIVDVNDLLELLSNFGNPCV